MAMVCSKWAEIEPSAVINGPAVVFYLDISRPGVDHGFDRQHHPRFYPRVRSRVHVVWNLRFFVKFETHTVTAEFPHNAETGAGGVFVYRCRDVFDSVSIFCSFDAPG